MEIELRNILQNDLKVYGYWMLPIHSYHKYNGPYFEKLTNEEVEKEINKLSVEFQNGNNPLSNKKFISNSQKEILGEVSWYWKSRETNWLEIGIVIYNDKYWGKGIGTKALRLWIQEVFQSNNDLIRIGLTTWSGNEGMIKLAKKLNMKKEAQYRKARIIEGIYYDSVSFGILKYEWDQFESKY